MKHVFLHTLQTAPFGRMVNFNDLFKRIRVCVWVGVWVIFLILGPLNLQVGMGGLVTSSSIKGFAIFMPEFKRKHAKNTIYRNTHLFQTKPKAKPHRRTQICDKRSRFRHFSGENKSTWLHMQTETDRSRIRTHQSLSRT